ncbi:hypothetical protein HN481_02850 [Candidatus Parcubacteria bacterium]|jgi:hypothetical protein|nr:hypothetical protein [Candidatus Parcubacteria bacterium]
MNTPNFEALEKFDIKSLPNLDVVTLAALELFMSQGLPTLNLGNYKKPMVVGSVNAFFTGKILFENAEAVFANESDYKQKFENYSGIDGVILVSASGSKHSIEMADFFKKKKVETRLLTNNVEAPAKKYIDEDKFFVFPKNREPYTYNTSTYMGMILGHTGEDPKKIYNFLHKKIDKIIPNNFADYDSYYFILPSKFDAIRDMFLTKFDEILQPEVSGRVFTVDQCMHAKNVILSPKECFISFDYKNKYYGVKDARVHVPLSKDADYGTLMAVAYYMIGKIQSQYPPYFQNNIEDYIKRASKVFGYELKAIVE